MTFKLSIQKSENKNLLESKEFDDIIREIIQTQNTNFLDGKVNLIEYLISKCSQKKIELSHLSEISEIQLIIQENFLLLNEFGTFLPNLIYLNLSSSFIKTIEEIGSSFVNLKHLNVSNCQLCELTGSD